MSIGTIFGLQPFEPKRLLVLPCEGGEITLYVLDGKAYPTEINELGSRPRKVIYSVHFGGWGGPWGPGFENPKLIIPSDRLVVSEGGLDHYTLEVIFRLVPLERGGQTAEVVAVSYDGGETFYENELCTLPKEYDKMEAKVG